MEPDSTPRDFARIWHGIGAILALSLVMALRADAAVQGLLLPPAGHTLNEGLGAAQLASPPPAMILPATLSQPDLALSQSIRLPNARTLFFVGETVSFEISVTNTGRTTLSQLPLMVRFDTTCLAYQVNSAQPIETYHDDAIGLVQWYDLTASNLGDLAPGQQFTIVTYFNVIGPCRNGYNTTTVSGALDEYGQTAPGREATVAFTCLVQAAIGDYIWNDSDGDGRQNEGRNRGINGVKVRLYRDDGNGIFEPGTSDILADTQTTTGDGGYLFMDFAPGAYWVDVSDTGLATTGYTFIAGPESGPKPQLITVNADTHSFEADFGYAGKGSISGAAFYDWNQDGMQGPDEAGIGGVQVCLYRDHDEDGQLDDPGDTWIACMNTDPTGVYAFPPQLPGGYLLAETQPGGLQDTTPNVLAIPLVVVGPIATATHGFGEILFGRLGGAVFVDLNANGQRDPSETIGLANIPLHVTGINLLGAPVDTVITATNGRYLSQGLLPGAYLVTAPEVFNAFLLTSLNPQMTTLTIAKSTDLDLNVGYVYPMAVEVHWLAAAAGRDHVTLAWLVLGDLAPAFHIWRADNAKGIGAARLTGQPIMGTANTYQYLDQTVTRGQTYWYWLEAVGDGQRTGPQVVTVPWTSVQAFLPTIGR